MASLKKRGKTYYAQYYVGQKQVRKCLHTSSLQIAKEKLRKIESGMYRGEEISGPTKTPTADVVAAYIERIRAVKTREGADSDIWYLSDIFGPICDGLKETHTSRKGKRSARGCGRDKMSYRIRSEYFEQISTQEIADIIMRRVKNDGIAPKTANRYREILNRLFSWAISQCGIRIPGGQNPAAQVERQKESAPEITFLSTEEISKQMAALDQYPKLKAAVATLIFAGLRRQELLYLQPDDIDFGAGEHGVIRIWAKTVGKHSWEPKTKQNRAVPISKTLRCYLNEYEVFRKPSPWYFPSPKGLLWQADNFYHALQDANRAAGLSWNCLQYRHTFGSQLARAGVSLYAISKLMGNSPAIAERHYAALAAEVLHDQVEFLDQAPGVEMKSRPASLN